MPDRTRQHIRADDRTRGHVRPEPDEGFVNWEFEYERFVKTIQQRAQISWEEAERAAQATLTTLAERISTGQARDIAEQLPPQARAWLRSDDGAKPFHADDFLRRVAEREGVDVDTAERHAKAVFSALPRVVKRRELEDMAAELPKDFEPLLAGALAEPEPVEEPLPADDFVARVAERAGVSYEVGSRATEAVLETLAERIAGGEVDDLEAQLPEELHVPLERGKVASGGKAKRMSLEQFIVRVAEREGVPDDEAREHAHAVFETLREAVTEKEFDDMAAELPDEYRPVLA